MAFFLCNLRDKICNSLLNDAQRQSKQHVQCFYCYSLNQSQTSLCCTCGCCQSTPSPPQILSTFYANYRHHNQQTPKLGTQTLLEIEDEVKKVESLVHRAPLLIKETYKLTGPPGRLMKVKIAPPNHKSLLLLDKTKRKRRRHHQAKRDHNLKHNQEQQQMPPPTLFRDLTINQAIDLKVIHFAGFPVIYTYVFLVFYVVSLFFHIAVWHYILCLRLIVQLSFNVQ